MFNGIFLTLEIEILNYLNNRTICQVYHVVYTNMEINLYLWEECLKVLQWTGSHYKTTRARPTVLGCKV